MVTGLTPSVRTLWLAILLAVVFRVGVYAWMIVSPIANEGGDPVSPLLLQSGIDFGYYWSVYLSAVEAWPDLLAIVGTLPFTETRVHLPGPGFLGLLAIFDYQESNTLPLTLFYLAVGIVLAALWLAWMWRQGLPFAWLAAFALLPTPVWLSANISTDLPFALATGAFFLIYAANEDGRQRYILGLAVAVTALLFRPNAVVLLLFLAADLILRRDAPPRLRVWGVVAALGLFLPAFYYYLPSFTDYSDGQGLITYFGISQVEYLGGAFESLPALIDRPLSWLSLAGAKLLYFVGLRPTYGVTPAPLVAVRAVAGIVLLPGMIYAIWYAPRRTKLFLIVFMLPFILGASQDRYNLPILPILFYYGALFYIAAWSRVRGAKTTSERHPT